MKTALVWFKNDLRLHDNETLIKAIEQNDRIVPVYCFDDQYYQTSPFGYKRTGAFRLQFLLQALQDLDNSLRKLGSGLVIVRGNTANELHKLAIEHNASSIYTAEEVAYEELNTLQEVVNKMHPQSVKLHFSGTSTLFHAADLPFRTATIPDVFTTFRQKVEAVSKVRHVHPQPSFITSPVIPPLQLPTLSTFSLSPVEIDIRAAIHFVGGESKALERLQYYIGKSQLVSSYKETRNQMVGADYSSKFSAWLACGSLSPRHVYHFLKQYEQTHSANDSTYWLVFELLWRDYFHFAMKKYGHKFFLKNGIRGTRTVRNVHNAEALLRWVNGTTGVDFVDANMLELKLTGFMSNRGRQNVASYLCNDLKVDWRYGAAYFEQQLIDYDVCSNWCNWAYVAGVGNDPRPNRYFNIKKQADQYDTDKKFRNLWLAGAS